MASILCPALRRSAEKTFLKKYKGFDGRKEGKYDLYKKALEKLHVRIHGVVLKQQERNKDEERRKASEQRELEEKMEVEESDNEDVDLSPAPKKRRRVEDTPTKGFSFCIVEDETNSPQRDPELAAEEVAKRELTEYLNRHPCDFLVFSNFLF